MKILEQILGEDPKKQFLPQHFTRIPFSRPNAASDFKNLLNWEEVKKIVQSRKSILRIVKDGMMVKDHADLSFDDTFKYYNEGHTLLIRYAEEGSESLNEICKDFEKSFHTKVDIQLYCTPEGHNAFGWHYDVEEVFIIQAKGSKTYSIRQNTIHPNPLVSSIPKDLNYEQEKSNLQLKVTLEEGDFLYIPSGWWHIARTERESMHISIGLMPNSAIDIAQFLPKHLSLNPFWRTRMPVHQEFSSHDEEIHFYQEAMKKLGASLSAELSSNEFISNFLKWKKSRAQ